MTASDDRMDARDWSLLAVLSVLWGGSFFFNGVVLRELPPLTVVFLRVALAYIVFFQVLRRSGATNVMLVTLLIPVTAILLGYLVLGEGISWREIIGALVIGSALLLIDGRALRLVRGVFSTPTAAP